VAEASGCFGSHGPGGTTGLPDSGNGIAVPAFTREDLTSYAKNEGEIREWILDGMPRRVRQQEDSDDPALPPGHPFNAVMAPNIWVDSIPGFRETAYGLYQAFDALGARLLSAIARSVRLPENFFDDKVDLGNSVLRVIHYPPMPPEPTPSVRAGAHEDINVITLLLGAEEPGLEVLSKKGEWLPINPSPGSLVCNVGDMLQRLTNKHLRSTTHRVVNPPRERASKARYSLPFFLHFNPDFLIKTMPQYIDDRHPDQFPVPISSHEYLQERLREIKLI
jgi:isopenicillin N synthase-like dioxygenase